MNYYIKKFRLTSALSVEWVSVAVDQSIGTVG
jgi:hypothetical protein